MSCPTRDTSLRDFSIMTLYESVFKPPQYSFFRITLKISVSRLASDGHESIQHHNVFLRNCFYSSCVKIVILWKYSHLPNKRRSQINGELGHFFHLCSGKNTFFQSLKWGNVLKKNKMRSMLLKEEHLFSIFFNHQPVYCV